MRIKSRKILYAITLACIFLLTGLLMLPVKAEEDDFPQGGGYCVTGQVEDALYTTQVYDSSNGLSASEANYILGASDGYIWVGANSGVMRFDGNNFTRMDTAEGLTNAMALFEDSRGRIWVGTNDNGVVVIDGEKRTHITYKDGLPSSTICCFAEDNDGYVYIGTATGICCADKNLKLRQIGNERLTEERILKMESDKNGRIYGQTKSGLIFLIEYRIVTEIYSSEELAVEKITTILVDQNTPGKVYMGTEGDSVYYGDFGAHSFKMNTIDVSPLFGVHWLSHDCGRVWVASADKAGYLDEHRRFHQIEDLPFDSGIEMMTSDYQGNMWIASSSQGIVKIVTNHFKDVMREAGYTGEVVNAACLYKDRIVIGTDHGLKIIEKDGTPLENKITELLKDTKVSCLAKGHTKDLWIGTYSNNMGLIHVDRHWAISQFTIEKGLPDNEIRDVRVQSDGQVLVATNGGMAIISNGSVKRTVGAEDGLKNTFFLAVEQGKNGIMYAGTDGDGMYAIDKTGVHRIGRDDGLTSDVIMRIKRDDERGVYWLVTSNSIEYMKEGQIRQVTTFPSSNNYDLFFDSSDHMWVVSSIGLYKVHVDDMLQDMVTDYNLYTEDSGMTGLPTAQGHSILNDNGNLYIPVRNGLCSVNIEHFSQERIPIKADISSIYCGDERLVPDKAGNVTIPASGGRIRIMPAVLDYSLLNPRVSVYMEGKEEEGITVKRSDLSPVEYTNLDYGNYVLHVLVTDDAGKTELANEVIRFTKEPQLLEMPVVRFLSFLIVVLAAGLFVWRFMTTTVIRRQYEEIRQARDEAQRANSAKSRFLANMSREIRTPINTIMGMNEMSMREDSTNVPQPYFMSMMNYAFDIRNASQSLLTLVNDLLDITMIESGKMNLTEQEYDLREMLRYIVSTIKTRSIEKDLTFEVKVDEMLPSRLYGDQGKLRQIILNLLTNAVKYTENGGFTFTFDMDAREDEICFLRICVKDTGIGMKPEEMEKLFKAYEDLDEQEISHINGSGLGLDISYRFAQLLGGSLTCESVYGKGSEFTLVVQQKSASKTPLGPFEEYDDNAVKGPYVPLFVAPDADILIVDDNPMNLTVIKNLLKSTRVFVSTASNGQECLEKIGDTKFDVVLLDHMMQGMDGVETLERIRENNPDLPVYAMTANSLLGEEFFTEKGFNGCLQKPIDSRELEKIIMRHLPEEMMEKPSEIAMSQEPKEIPPEYQWIREVKEIDPEEGVKNAGSVPGYIFALTLFMDTIDHNIAAIREALEQNDLKQYTVKVRAVKSSARIIGAKNLMELAAKLENAGKKEDRKVIDACSNEMLSMYEAFKEKLARLHEMQKPAG
ncbi:MAG: response regulator [Lachnospiraceae bacterium]|nr:response regulator [Lachnospiraceae bacterium]